MNSRHNYLSISMPCENYGRPPSVVRISAFSDFEATHAKQGYRYRVVPYCIGNEAFACFCTPLSKAKAKQDQNESPFSGMPEGKHEPCMMVHGTTLIYPNPLRIPAAAWRFRHSEAPEWNTSPM